MRGKAVKHKTHRAKNTGIAALLVLMALTGTPRADGELLLENVETGTKVYLEENGDLKAGVAIEKGLPEEVEDNALILTHDGDQKIVLSDTKMNVENGVRQDNISDPLGGDLAIDHVDHTQEAPRAMVGSSGETDGVLAVAGKAYSSSTPVAATYYVDGMAVFEQNGAGAETELAYLSSPVGKTMFTDDGMVNHYHVTDHLGSTRLVVNDEGEVVEALSYMAYGAMHSLMPPAGGEETVKEKFTGKEFDEDGSVNGASGIQAYHFGARMYDPEIAMWLADDPMAQFWNSYSYTGARPISSVDHNGCWSCQSEAETIEEANACTEAENDVYDASSSHHNDGYVNKTESNLGTAVSSGYSTIQGVQADIGAFNSALASGGTGPSRGITENQAARMTALGYEDSEIAMLRNPALARKAYGAANATQVAYNGQDARGLGGAAFPSWASVVQWAQELGDKVLDEMLKRLKSAEENTDATNTGTSGYTDYNFLSINPVGTGTGAVIGGLLTGGNPLGIGGGALLGSMGVYGGVMVAADGTAYPYLGISLSPSVGPSYGGGLTLSYQSPSEGFNIAGSASAGFGGQVGYTFGENGGGFMEAGPMTPGAGVDFFWSWK